VHSTHHPCCAVPRHLCLTTETQPYTSNIYVRRVLSGEFTVVNQHLLHDLNRLGLWNPSIKNELVSLRDRRYA